MFGGPTYGRAPTFGHLHMKRMKKHLALALLMVGSLGCSTELDVFAPYKEIPIVYATLSISKNDRPTTDPCSGTQFEPETTHYVKINRAFQGDGDALAYAAIPDSNEYNADQLIDARVQEWNGNTLVNEYFLNDTIIPDRLPGTFYYPEQKVYYFNATLNEDHEYRFVAMIKGVEVSARTPIVDNFGVSSNVQSGTFRPRFHNGTAYQDYELVWTSAPDGRRYEAYYTFYYNEVRNGVAEVKHFTKKIGSEVTTNTNGSEELVVTVVGEDFYRSVRDNVPVDPGVERREIMGIRFHWAVASDDFHTFLQLNEPITGIVEDRPDFTNVTNGYGMFVSRYFEWAPGSSDNIVPGCGYRLLHDNSLEELAFGQYTGGLGFCSAYNVSDGTPYECP